MLPVYQRRAYAWAHLGGLVESGKTMHTARGVLGMPARRRLPGSRGRRGSDVDGSDCVSAVVGSGPRGDWTH